MKNRKLFPVIIIAMQSIREDNITGVESVIDIVVSFMTLRGTEYALIRNKSLRYRIHFNS